MKKTAKFILPFLIAAAFIWLFFNANTFASMVANRDNPIVELEHFQPEAYAQDPVYFGFYSFMQYNDIFQNSIITAWAFCETENSNDGRKAYMVLDSGDNAYKLSCGVTARPDILAKYPNKKIAGQYIGANADFSPVGIKQGTYRMHLILEENEENKGVVDTSYLFVQDELGFRKASFTIDELPNQTPHIIPLKMLDRWKSKPIQFEIYANKFYTVSDTRSPLAVIDGWAYSSPLGNKSNKWMSVILKGAQSAYEFGAAVIPHSDITSYQNPALKDVTGNTGFFCKFYTDTFPDGEYDMYLYVVENEEDYGIVRIPYTIIKDENGVQWKQGA